MILKETGKVLCVLLLSAFMTSSCQTDGMLWERSQSQPVEVGLYAGDALTRTTILPNGLSAVWQPGDQLALWARNSAGDFVLQNQIFTTYGLDGKHGFFTSVLSGAMPEDSYTYLCSYPAPMSVDGTKATFNIPSIQDGQVSEGVDVMIATPVQSGSLQKIPDMDGHTNLKMEMNRMLHQFRFYIPEGDVVLGEEKIERINLSFPAAVAGNVTLDLENVDEPGVLTGGQTDVSLELSRPIGVSHGDAYEFACLALSPVQFPEGNMSIRAYTDDKIAILDPVDLKEKTCLAGHSTPVQLKIKALVDYAGIINVTLDANNLGENPKQITLTAPSGCKWGDGGSNVYVYNPGREILVGETLTFKFETDLNAYLAFNGQNITVTYDSENALLSETLKMPAITAQGQTSLSMSVPYLLFEDFSCIYAEGESYGNNDYSSSERDQPGKSLDSYMSHKGWNAARFWIKGNSVRINTRYQEVKVLVSFASYHYGRLDTPQLSGLKAGKSVPLSVMFDAGGNRNSKSSLTVSSPAIAVATHGKTGVLDGIPTGTKGLGSNYSTTLADFGTTHESVSIEDNCSSDAFNDSFATRTATIFSASSKDRICFYVTYSPQSGTGNCEFNAYIDNIRVKIAK